MKLAIGLVALPLALGAAMPQTLGQPDRDVIIAPETPKNTKNICDFGVKICDYAGQQKYCGDWYVKYMKA